MPEGGLCKEEMKKSNSIERASATRVLEMHGKRKLPLRLGGNTRSPYTTHDFVLSYFGVVILSVSTRIIRLIYPYHLGLLSLTGAKSQQTTIKGEADAQFIRHIVYILILLLV